MADEDRPARSTAPRTYTPGELTRDLLAERLDTVLSDTALPPDVTALQAALTRYATARVYQQRVRIARALGLRVANAPDNEAADAALHLFDAVQHLPELQPDTGGGTPPANSPGEAPDSPPSAPDDPGGAGAAPPDLLPLSGCLRAAIDAGRPLFVYGGTPNPPTVEWLCQVFGGRVVWHERVPRRPVFSPDTVGVVMLQGLLTHGQQDALAAAAKRAGVPFARVNRPGRGEFRRAADLLSQQTDGPAPVLQ